MIAAEPYCGADPIFFVARAICTARTSALDALPPNRPRVPVRCHPSDLRPARRPCLEQPSFDVEFDPQVRLGVCVEVNAGALFDDCAPVAIGERSMVGPRTMFLSFSHPTRPEERKVPAKSHRLSTFPPITVAKPVTVGRHA
jgi:maltose O-acetyltransferase